MTISQERIDDFIKRTEAKNKYLVDNKGVIEEAIKQQADIYKPVYKDKAQERASSEITALFETKAVRKNFGDMPAREYIEAMRDPELQKQFADHFGYARESAAGFLKEAADKYEASAGRSDQGVKQLKGNNNTEKMQCLHPKFKFNFPLPDSFMDATVTDVIGAENAIGIIMQVQKEKVAGCVLDDGDSKAHTVPLKQQHGASIKAHP